MHHASEHMIVVEPILLTLGSEQMWLCKVLLRCDGLSSANTSNIRSLQCQAEGLMSTQCDQSSQTLWCTRGVYMERRVGFTMWPRFWQPLIRSILTVNLTGSQGQSAKKSTDTDGHSPGWISGTEPRPSTPTLCLINRLLLFFCYFLCECGSTRQCPSLSWVEI